MPNIWMDVDTALPEVPVNVMALIDSTDFKTREESVTFDQAGLDLVWNFVSTAGIHSQVAVTPTNTGGDYDWVNQGNGMYTIEIPLSGGGTINNDAEGFGWFSGFATGILPWVGPIIGFRAAAINNALIDSAFDAIRGFGSPTALPNAAANAPGGLLISSAGSLDMDAKLATTDEIGTAGVGLTDIGGMSTAMKAEVLVEINAAIDTAISELGVGAPTDTPTLRTSIMLVYMALRNKTVVQTSGTDALEIYNNAGTKIASKLLSDDGSDYTEAEMV